jgi:hypothetical protein
MATQKRTLTLIPSPLGYFAIDPDGDYLDVWIRHPGVTHAAMRQDGQRRLRERYPESVLELGEVDEDLDDLYIEDDGDAPDVH